jgi:hypothetical protein
VSHEVHERVTHVHARKAQDVHLVDAEGAREICEVTEAGRVAATFDVVDRRLIASQSGCELRDR